MTNKQLLKISGLAMPVLLHLIKLYNQTPGNHKIERPTKTTPDRKILITLLALKTNNTIHEISTITKIPPTTIRTIIITTIIKLSPY